MPYENVLKTYFTFPPVEDAACGEADNNKVISAR